MGQPPLPYGRPDYRTGTTYAGSSPTETKHLASCRRRRSFPKCVGRHRLELKAAFPW
jgi:hypothetical protein